MFIQLYMYYTCTLHFASMVRILRWRKEGTNFLCKVEFTTNRFYFYHCYLSFTACSVIANSIQE